ncbi:hypothetical protein [Shewanella sp. UCD-KL21]|uniref:hypothetical protein n=1 Tax=Shewanella sp. UCD-KL21 TaxID=1917164 RepID=UPI0009707F15|nr:hypothetical protein [Shewanella sp. UCD-KL21]
MDNIIEAREWLLTNSATTVTDLEPFDDEAIIDMAIKFKRHTKSSASRKAMITEETKESDARILATFHEMLNDEVPLSWLPNRANNIRTAPVFIGTANETTSFATRNPKEWAHCLSLLDDLHSDIKLMLTIDPNVSGTDHIHVPRDPYVVSEWVKPSRETNRFINSMTPKLSDKAAARIANDRAADLREARAAYQARREANRIAYEERKAAEKAKAEADALQAREDRLVDRKAKDRILSKAKYARKVELSIANGKAIVKRDPSKPSATQLKREEARLAKEVTVWNHKDFGDVIAWPVMPFRTKYNLSQANFSQLNTGKVKQTKGWTIKLRTTVGELESGNRIPKGLGVKSSTLAEDVIENKLVPKDA